REIIVEKENMAPKGEKLAMKGYAKWASTSAAYKMSAKMARTALKPWTRKATITNGPGPLKGWTDVRDFPAPSKQSFRSWFKERQKGGNAQCRFKIETLSWINWRDDSDARAGQKVYSVRTGACSHSLEHAKAIRRM